MYRKLFVLGLLVCVCMAGCQNTPQEVIQKSEGYQENAEIKTSDLKFDTLENVKKQSVEDLKIQTQNLILPSKLVWGDGENMYSLHLKFKEGFLEKRDEIAKLFGFQVKKWKVFDETSEDKILTEDREHLIEVGDNGFAAAIIPEYNKNRGNEQNPTKVIDILAGESSDVECNLNGDRVNIKDEIDYVESWIKGKWPYEKVLDYRVGKVILLKMGKLDRLSFSLYGYYQGILVTNIELGTELTKVNENGVQLYKTLAAEALANVIHPHQIAYFSNGNITCDKTKEQKEEQFLTVKSAIKLVEKNLSGFNKKKIEQIRANYRLNVQFSDTEYHGATRKKVPDYCKAGREIIVVPVYSFLIPKAVEQENGDASDYDDCNLYNYVDVNMLTGEVTTDLEEEF